MDYADAHGIVVIDETAAVGMNAAVAAVLGTKIDKVYSPETVSDKTREAHAQAIHELYERDKNRPSVSAIWSIANKPQSRTDESVAYLNRCSPWPRSLTRIGPSASSTS